MHGTGVRELRERDGVLSRDRNNAPTYVELAQPAPIGCRELEANDVIGKMNMVILARWLVALGIAIGLHAGAVLWALQEPVEPLYDTYERGAFIIEIADTTSSHEEDTPEIAIGRRSAEVAPVAASVAQQTAAAPQRPEEEPPVPETHDPPPEDALPVQPEETPKEEKPQQVQAAKAVDAPSVAPLTASAAAAPPKIENAERKAKVARGRNAGLSRIDRQAIESWQNTLTREINRHKRYPRSAEEARRSGVVKVAFTLDREGRILSSAIARSSGYDDLDQAALDLLGDASPLPAPPTSHPGETITLTVPVHFRWRK